jgi:hypothetical protein
VFRRVLRSIRVTENLTKALMKKVRTPAQREAFVKAQIMNAMHHESPRARHEKKIYIALHHIHAWGFSTSVITATAAQTKSTSFLTSMFKTGLIRYEVVLGKKYVLLTRKGLELLRNMTDPADEIAFERVELKHIHSVNLFAFQHNAYAQQLIASRQAASWEEHHWLSERQLRTRLSNKTQDCAKVPDACFITKAETIYFEIERSKKSKKEIEIMFMNLIRLIEHDGSHRVEIHFLRNFASSYLDVYERWLRESVCKLYSAGADGSVSELMTITLSPPMRFAMARITFINAC